MTDSHHVLTVTIVLGALGLWLMLPRGSARGRGAGIVMATIALGLGVSQAPRLGDWLRDGVFLILAGVTVVSAAAAVTFRNPIYCAIWFGQSMLGVAGLYFFAGAQFLAVAGVVVYAGAILVTFLFVLMLAQPDGRAPYDRASWEALISAATGMVIVGVLSMTLGGVFSPARCRDGSCTAVSDATETGRQCNCHPNIRPIAPPTEEALATGILSTRHVARLGGELFGRHGIAVEVVGVLLLAALVGAAAIVAHPRKD